MSRGIRPARTVGATLLGGLVGMIVLGAVGILIGRQLDLEGLATLLPVLWSAIVGILVGSAVALALAFRDEPTERRSVTVAVVLVPGALLFTGALVDVVDVMVVHPLTLAVLLPVLALLGRSIATRGTDGPDAT